MKFDVKSHFEPVVNKRHLWWILILIVLSLRFNIYRNQFSSAHKKTDNGNTQTEILNSAEKARNRLHSQAAREFVKLISTYQPENARWQFQAARKFLSADYAKKYDALMLGSEIQAIEATKRTQIFLIRTVETLKSPVSNKNTSILLLTGVRQKIISGQLIPQNELEYTISITSELSEEQAPYGVLISDVRLRRLKNTTVSR